MKINDTQDINPVNRLEESTPATAVQSRTVHDRVTVQHSENVAHAVATARAATSDARAARIRAIESSVAQGTYQPKSEQIADKLMDHAELDAHLRATLQL